MNIEQLRASKLRLLQLRSESATSAKRTESSHRHVILIIGKSWDFRKTC